MASAYENLASDLRRKVQGEVRFDHGTRGLYATDASNYRQVPIGVVIPRTIDDVLETIALARKYQAPILPRGGGTSLAGQCCNVAVVIDFSKYLNQLVELDPQRKIARVQPGIILDDLRNPAEKFHLTFGPDPATHNRCTIGGMIGNNSCGVHSVMAGKTDDNLESLDLVTYDGTRMRVGGTSDQELARIVANGDRRSEIYSRLRGLRDKYAERIRARFPDIPRRVSGYNLPFLLPEKGFQVARALAGSEGTCAVVLEATVRLVYSPPKRSLLVLGYPDVYMAADQVPELLTFGPIGLEGLDDNLVNDMKKKGLHAAYVAMLPEGKGWLLAEFGGATQEEAHANAKRLMDGLKSRGHAPNMILLDDPLEMKKIWTVRESGLGATAYVPGEGLTWEGWEDAAVPPERLGDYLRDFRKLLDKYNYRGDLYGHFGQACVHTRNNFDLETAEGLRKFRAFIEEAADLVVSYGGSISGEHGDGQARGELLEKMFGPELIEAFREFKSIWDPDGKMNPGKLVDPHPILSNLRLGTEWAPWKTKTYFQFPEDEGSIARATLRCVGVGACRRLEGGTMCPSFMATREELHTTRGRAHLLFEMFRGGSITTDWQNQEVRESLGLCLACKGCKQECPVGVDLATYKAEFLAHYYEGRLRPVSAYSMGLIFWWARAAAAAPGLVNFMTHAPVVSALMKTLGGIAAQREMPRFAAETFKEWFRRRGQRNQGKPKVLLWPDTFNNHFLPHTAIAATEVLERLGYNVVIPQAALCCGRPLYDFGMLKRARKLLRQVLRTLEPMIRAGIPVIGLEPSCLAVFRDELVNLFPRDELAQKLKAQSFLLSEFLGRQKHEHSLPQLDRDAIVHGHCHQKALMGMGHEEEVLAKLGVRFKSLDSGCCGMAGSFGFEKDHYEISQKIGERVLLPAVRSAPADTLIISNGFSCREQVKQGTGRDTLHLAEVLHMAFPLPGGERVPSEARRVRGRDS